MSLAWAFRPFARQGFFPIYSSGIVQSLRTSKTWTSSGNKLGTGRRRLMSLRDELDPHRHRRPTPITHRFIPTGDGQFMHRFISVHKAYRRNSRYKAIRRDWHYCTKSQIKKLSYMWGSVGRFRSIPPAQDAAYSEYIRHSKIKRSR